jgi:hypothetical protein
MPALVSTRIANDARLFADLLQRHRVTLVPSNSTTTTVAIGS